MPFDQNALMIFNSSLKFYLCIIRVKSKREEQVVLNLENEYKYKAFIQTHTN